MQLDNLHKSLLEVSEEAARSLRSLVPKRTGNLLRSIKAGVEGNEGYVEAEHYLEYIDKGVDGTEVKYGSIYKFTNKMPPISAFTAPTMSEKFAIAKSIYKKGIAPQNILENVEFNEDKLVEGFLKDIDGTIKDTH